jgi:hypothetical protein
MRWPRVARRAAALPHGWRPHQALGGKARPTTIGDKASGHDGQRRNVAHMLTAATSTPALRYGGMTGREGAG